MRFTIAPTLVLLGLVSVPLLAANAAETVVDKHLESVKEIYSWVNGAADGFVSDKLSVSRMVPNDLTTPLIVFATEDIDEDELLIQVPWTHILESDDHDLDDELGWYCGTAMKLKEELQKGSDSFYAPYVNYLNDEPENQLPAQYSRKAKSLLEELLGTHDDEYSRSPLFERDSAHNHRLMPVQITRGLDKHWHKMCKADPSDKIGERAAAFVIQRADDFILIPAYDAFNHRNPDPHNGKDYMNTRAETTFDEAHRSYAIRNIQKGEQLFISYNLCQQCGGRKYYGFGTAEMFRDYGFVEWYPQRWYYPGFGDYHSANNDLEANQFDMYRNEDNKDLTIVWTHLTKNKEKIDRFKVFLAREIRRLNHLNNIKWVHMRSWNETQWKDSGITDYEWTNIQNLLRANVVAMSIALEDLSRTEVPNSLNPGNPVYDDDYEDDEEEDAPRPPLTVSEEHSKRYTESHYDPLETPEIDDLAYYKFTCDIDQYQKFKGYVDTDTEETGRNQVLGFWESYLFNKGQDDVNVCFDVNNVIQTCSSNRPYKHEMMVHLAARYVMDVERVAIIGNGASMHLHEVLKYDEDLKYVLNLELDQSVTRKAFQHYKVDPHFDDPRVDWWFGTLEESLAVLPESYFGSFDLVLVDAPDSALAVPVPNSNQDVFSALRLLLKPETGVFAKNDLYFYETSQQFPNAIQLTYQSPMVCLEILSLGSEGVDFVHGNIWDHEVEDMDNLLYLETPDDDAPERHEMVHDYRTHTAIEHDWCSNSDFNDAEQAFSVLELLTFEKPGFRRSEFSKESFQTIVQNLIEGVIDDVSFTIFKDGITYLEDPQKMVLVVIEEGYMAARLQEDEDDNDSFYVGFDIQLWSGTQHLPTIVASMRQVLRSQKARQEARPSIFGKDETENQKTVGDVSSHKIVVDGIYGTKATTGTGPNSVATTRCEKPNADAVEDGIDSSSSNEDIAPIVIDEVVSLTRVKNGVAVAFCGSDTVACTSQKVLVDHKLVKDVIPIYDCTVGTDKTLEDLRSCERSIVSELTTEVQRFGRLNLLVLDSGASKELHQITNSIFETYGHRAKFLKPHSVALTTWLSPRFTEEPHRLEFLDRFRKQIHHDPVRMAEFELVPSSSSPNTTYGFGVVSTKDSDANGALHTLETKLNKRLKETSPKSKLQLRNLRGGLYEYVKPRNHNPKEFTQADYDLTLAQNHFDNQNPLAVQSVFRYIAMKKGFLSSDVVQGILRGAAKITCPENMRTYPMGDGGVFLLVGTTFTAIAVWDGKDSVTVNIAGISDQGEADARSIDYRFQLLTANTMSLVSTDIQPRGVGGVVNLKKDLLPIDLQSIALGEINRQEEELQRRQEMLDDDYEEDYDEEEIDEDDEESPYEPTGDEL